MTDQRATLLFPDARSARDALTFAERAARIGDDGLHLLAAEGVLTMTAPALLPRSILDRTPFVLALRSLAVDPELACDLTVEALEATADPHRVALPDRAIAPGWAAVPLPREGWTHTRTVAAGVLDEVAQRGIRAVAQAIPERPGLDAVQKVRAAVWGEPEPELGDLPRGTAFAATAFGLIGEADESARILVSGRWVRIALRRGHVLLRGPAAAGLTPVRRTGRQA